MLALVVAHLVLAGLLPLVSARSRPAAFAVAALPPSVALLWAFSQTGPALGGGVTESVAWAPALGLTLSFRLDALALVMIILVSGVGAVILVHSIGYFDRDSPQATRSAALLLAFAGAMLGLVLADDLLTLYVFWELTSIASFLLVGQGGERRAERRAAVQALLVTVFGGLAMLLGFVLLGQAAGTYRISEILADPPRGGLVPVALVLVLLGAFTKSAQLPFHPWLPAAMVAPTPVSAYLHAASMVKAGVYLVARLSPGFADLAVWWAPVVVVGLGTMLVGGWRALGETDLKKVLAFGTVSQLGFLMVLLGAGDRTAALAGAAMLLAHALFKAPLFLTVGTIDHATGTRDLRKLSGLRTALPGTAVAAALAAASMAGLPPLLGFIGKEAAFEAFVDEGGARGYLVAFGLLAGSMLTAAYSARFLWGAFATKPGVEATVVHHRPGALLTGPIWLCAVAGLVLGGAYVLVDLLVMPYAAAYPDEHGYHLALWHGFNIPLLFSALAIGGGLLLHRARATVDALSHHSPVDAQRGYRSTVDGVSRLALVVTGRLQAGSLPVYLGVILVTFILLPGVAAVVAGQWPADQPVYDALVQVPLALVVVVAALALTRSHRRFTAVLLVGVIGYGVGGLFIIDGAPDLALAQFLVETLSMVAFVFVLRRLPAHFTERRPTWLTRLPRLLIAAVGGITVAGIAVVLSAARVGPAVASGEFVRLAPEGAGANNVVSAIIVDFRALDTVGEIGVLFIAAAGVSSLVLATRYDTRRKRESGREQVSSGQSGPDHEREVLG
ncbi:hydrogen gas-evolving membrane-bound hydrogenase subunit E [Pseudonocardia lacus]|uniref:hydrogen gas-evolving membrane-bound hydrogenase subunit E n=1 Tax=Pseudonocardia lacus TaxID=2835865 RepID=UPI001BDC50F6|nr:hydrogen gas-evolving membrane-bound hydrogenase subunit E [Pseudonocardia lacus]